MRVLLSAVTIVATLSVAYALVKTAQAQQPNAGAQATRYGIGVVDISYIFKHHLRFKAMMDQMKEDVKKTEAGVGSSIP